ncbi:MAG: Nucleotidyltransferase domain protein [Candidatus Methanolliviera sp. GoM_oil]|nr:MAG: Nucleotidyltransferase domain protein [Candidatus Methanolliviera sp. GoM_oil]
MKSLRDIMEILADHREELQRIYKVKEIGIFGSYTRGEQKRTSDIDILVEFENEGSIGGFEFIGSMNDLEDHLRKILGIKPHLASKRHAMNSDKWKYIKNEVVYIFEEEMKEKIKSQILMVLGEMGISVEKIILFGSRARGDFSRFSDYDILLIVNRTFTTKEKMVISERVRDSMVKLHIPTDIIIKSEEEIAYYRDKIGSIVREALKEGVSI